MRIRERRILLGMTQKRFAEAIGTTHQQVSKYEAGRDRVAAGILYRIAQALDVDIGYLFEGLDQTAGPAGPSPTWTALAQNIVNIADPEQRRALLRLALLMAGAGRSNDGDQGQDDG
jgi:transcriptional regulator with XRE-family HTH domain